METHRPVIELEHAVTLTYPDGRRVRLDATDLTCIMEAMLAYGWLWVRTPGSLEEKTGGDVTLTCDEEGCWHLGPLIFGEDNRTPRRGGANGFE